VFLLSQSYAYTNNPIQAQWLVCMETKQWTIRCVSKNDNLSILIFCISQHTVATAYRWGRQIYELLM